MKMCKNCTKDCKSTASTALKCTNYKWIGDGTTYMTPKGPKLKGARKPTFMELMQAARSKRGEA